MKKAVYFTLLVMFVIVLGGCGGNPSKSAKDSNNTVKQVERTGVIVGTDVNVRNGPGRDHGVIGTFTEGEKVRILGPKGYWTEVERKNKERGWVSNWYLIELVYGKDKTMPEVIIFQPDLDSNPSPCEADIRPQKDLTVRETWTYDAQETGKIKAEERAEVLEFKSIVRPKGTITYEGKKVYVLTPSYGLFFLYYADGKVKFVRIPGHNSGFRDVDKFIPGWKQAFEETEAANGYSEWVKVKGENVEGWFGVKDTDGVPFYTEKGSGIFLTRLKKNK